MSETPYVIFKNVKKSYNGEEFVVTDFNLEVKKGEFVTMLGPSGSGKTTCLMMLAGFESVTGGDIFLNNKSIKNIPPYKRNIGVVFQNYALFPHMTIGENLSYPLKIRKLDKSQIKKKVKEMLDLVELGEFHNRYPSQLSGGQKQRVALVRALIYSPEIVLMDEPLGALDKKLREQMQYEIKRLHDQLGFTVIYVTHDQIEALTISDRIVVFNEGLAQQIANPITLYEKPNNSFVANFMGENNKIIGEVIDCKNEKNDRGEKITVSQVQTSFGIVFGYNPNMIQPGEKVMMSIRPEKFNISSKKDAKVKNIFKAIIKEFIYIGDHVRVVLHLSGKNKETTRILVKYSLSRHAHSFKQDEKVIVSWHRHDCRILDYNPTLVGEDAF